MNPVSGFNVLAAAGTPLTTAAAIKVLSRGGNAIDAGVAATLAAAVVEPTASYSLGSEVAALIYDVKSNSVVAVNGQGCAPKKATIGYFRSRQKSLIPVGPGPDAPLSITVPGVLDALIISLDRYGTFTFGQVAEPALEYAENGFPVYPYMSSQLKSPSITRQLTEFFPEGARYFRPNGHVPEPGERFLQKDLAKVLHTLVDAERKTRDSGRSAALETVRDAFYKGEIAQKIASFCASIGALLSLEDLSTYRSKLEPPIKCTFRGIDLYGHEAWSQGATLLQALNILEGFDLRAMGHNSPAYIHLLTETFKLVMADREKYYGDPHFVEVPTEALLSKEYAAERRKLVNLTRAYPEMAPYGDPVARRSVGGTLNLSRHLGAEKNEDAGTTHLSVVDAEGNIFVATPSGGKLDSGVVIPGFGFTLSHRCETFYLDESQANALQPRKRPRTTLVCYLAFKGQRPWLTFGCAGGDNQPQADLQLFLNVVEFKMDPQEAVNALRFSSSSFPGSFYPHTYAPGQLNLEPSLQRLQDELASRGHNIKIVDHVGQGAIVAQIDPETGRRTAGVDPRRPTFALGW